mgnify:CR=1 FL=1
MGPYKIVKLQSNRVTYEIEDENGKIIKAHHIQLKLLRELPENLKQYIPMRDNEENYRSVEEDESDDCCGLGVVVDSDSTDDDLDIDANEKSESNDKLEPVNSEDSEISVGKSSDERNEKCQPNYIPSILQSKQIEEISSAKSFNDSRNFTPAPLEKLHCSEPVDFKYPVGFILDENSLINTNLNIKKHSTPKKNADINIPLDSSINSRISFCSNVDHDESVSKDVEKAVDLENVNDFLSFVEQSVQFQQEIVGSLEWDHFGDKNYLDSPVNTNARRLFSTNIETMEGSGEIASNVGSASSQVVNILKDKLNSLNKSIVEFKLGKNYLARKLWKINYGSSTSNRDSEFSGVESEVCDTLSPLPIRLFNNDRSVSNRRHTRAMGPVTDEPYVQPRILERKTSYKRM